jgi:hypothetical protein
MSDHGQAPGAIPPEPNASEQPHDVLAAEQFAMPAPQAARRSGPLELPPEPDGSEEPHDVLAAEQFAMPAPPPHVAFEPPPAVPGVSGDVAAHAAPSGAALVSLLRAWRDRRRARRG